MKNKFNREFPFDHNNANYNIIFNLKEFKYWEAKVYHNGKVIFTNCNYISNEAYLDGIKENKTNFIEDYSCELKKIITKN